jgi:uncharacterized OsmC-like protein
MTESWQFYNRLRALQFKVDEHGMHSQLDRPHRHALRHGVSRRNRQWPHAGDGRRAGRRQARKRRPKPGAAPYGDVFGCTAYDVVLILKRGRHDVRGCSVKLSAERAEVDPKVFTAINMHFTVTGKGIPAVAVERAIVMSHDKYCSASIMLGKTATISTSFELVEA